MDKSLKPKLKTTINDTEEVHTELFNEIVDETSRQSKDDFKSLKDLFFNDLKNKLKIDNGRIDE